VYAGSVEVDGVDEVAVAFMLLLLLLTLMLMLLLVGATICDVVAGAVVETEVVLLGASVVDTDQKPSPPHVS